MTTFEEKGLISRVQARRWCRRLNSSTLMAITIHHIICRSCKKIEIIHECIGDQLDKIGTRLAFQTFTTALNSMEFAVIAALSRARFKTSVSVIFSRIRPSLVQVLALCAQYNTCRPV